jgi:hypothetical protein
MARNTNLRLRRGKNSRSHGGYRERSGQTLSAYVSLRGGGDSPCRGRSTEVQGRPLPPRAAGVYSGEDLSSERGNPAGACLSGGWRRNAGRGHRGRSSPRAGKPSTWRRTPVVTTRPARRAPARPGVLHHLKHLDHSQRVARTSSAGPHRIPCSTAPAPDPSLPDHDLVGLRRPVHRTRSRQ